MFVLQNKDDKSFVPMFAFEKFSLYVDMVTIAELLDKDVFKGSFSSAFKVLNLYSKFSKDKTWFDRSEDNKRFFRYVILNSVIRDALTENDIKNLNEEIIIEIKDPLSPLTESLSLDRILRKYCTKSKKKHIKHNVS